MLDFQAPRIDLEHAEVSILTEKTGRAQIIYRGGITREALPWIKFGNLQGQRALFDGEPVTFE